jgi:ABC-type phosphate/phosphonate transport system permease subunit
LINGASRSQAIPRVATPAQLLARDGLLHGISLECAIRSSVILGFVGAAIRQQMDLSMRMLAGG